MFKALCSAAHLAKSGIRTLARVAPRVTAQTLERINATWAASTTALEKALADAELDMLGKLGIEAPFGQVAGTSLKAPIASDNPLVHFSDALIEKTGRDKVAAKTAEIGAKAEQVSQKVAGIYEKLKNIKATCAELHPSLGDSAKIEQMLAQVKDCPGAISCDNGEGPVLKLLKNGANQETLSTAKGAMYELEVAHDLYNKGEKITFGGKVGNSYTTKEFDIITSNKLIECKNIDWSKYSEDQINTVISKLKEQSIIATEHNKSFVLFSKNKIPEMMKTKLNKHNITFFEGY